MNNFDFSISAVSKEHLDLQISEYINNHKILSIIPTDKIKVSSNWSQEANDIRSCEGNMFQVQITII